MPAGGSTWDIKLKNSPDDPAYDLKNILARKEQGTQFNSRPEADTNNAMSRRMDIINQGGDAQTASVLSAVKLSQQKKQAGALAVGNIKQKAAQAALSAQQNIALQSISSKSKGSTSANVGIPSAGDPKGIGARASSIASKLTATPYKWGGTTTKGFDCSGLVQYVYGKMGIKMPRVSQQQATMGTKTSIANLKPGDLVAWGSSPRTATHIAIYAGNGQIWEAAHAGTNVRTRSISAKESGIMGISIKR